MDRRSAVWLAANGLLWLLVGSASTLLVQRVRDRRPSLGDLADEASARMSRLDLSGEQKNGLARIREEWRARVVTEERDWLDRLDQAAAAADQSVVELLTPEQARRYRELALPPRSN